MKNAKYYHEITLASRKQAELYLDSVEEHIAVAANNGDFRTHVRYKEGIDPSYAVKTLRENGFQVSVLDGGIMITW